MIVVWPYHFIVLWSHSEWPCMLVKFLVEFHKVKETRVQRFIFWMSYLINWFHVTSCEV